ncbi:hypothetical protein LTR66_006367 [Elasticomyces elasticus]|nr:hypothetical protein LTR66_006367 [Elasticomyces elasticus]
MKIGQLSLASDRETSNPNAPLLQSGILPAPLANQKDTVAAVSEPQIVSSSEDRAPSSQHITFGDVPHDIQRGSTSTKPGVKRLFEPGDENLKLQSPKRSIFAPTAVQSPSKRVSSSRTPGIFELPAQARYPNIVLQPDSRPISQEQLAAEVKGIYAAIVMLEARCISMDNKENAVTNSASPETRSKARHDHWQAGIALHRSLQYEHHDFLLASQHPSASQALRRLAGKYSMPARMWKHGIHSFLEVLRHRLPESLDYMLAFIYLAYQMMALLYETVPAFEDTWIECLGDLGRYRMAIEEDQRDREVWGGVARFWYGKAADKNPTVGRLYHHLAILARPNVLQQLYFYARSLSSVLPFLNARDSILTLFDPVLGRHSPAPSTRPDCSNACFVKAQGLIFRGASVDELDVSFTEYSSQLDKHIGRTTAKWKEQGVFIIVTAVAACLQYGNQQSPLRLAFEQKLCHSVPGLVSGGKQPVTASRVPSSPGDESPASSLGNNPEALLGHAFSFMVSILSVALRRIGDRNVLPCIHVSLVFLSSLSLDIYTMVSLLDAAPWEEIASFLNSLARSTVFGPGIEGTAFLQPEEGDRKPLPEDYLIRGQIWTQTYFPDDWFGDVEDDEERLLELISTSKARAERTLWLGINLTRSHSAYLQYDPATRTITTGAGRDRASPPQTSPVDRACTPPPSTPTQDVQMSEPINNLEGPNRPPEPDTNSP